MNPWSGEALTDNHINQQVGFEMKRLLLCVLLLVLLAGCGTRRHEMVFEAGHTALPSDATYSVGTVLDQSGFVFPEDENRTDIAQSMEFSLVAALREEGMYKEEGASYSIDVRILEYEPGNAFGRWLLPGVGSTVLQATSRVGDSEDVVGNIETRNTIDAGGASTINAWRTIFKDGAAEIVKELKESMGLLVKKKQ